MSDFAPTVINDLNLANKDQLVSYLRSNNVPFGETALKPELLAKAREFFATQAAAPGATKEQPKLTDPGSVDTTKAMAMLEAKGFKDKDEIIHYLNALERKEVDLRNREITVEEHMKIIEKKDIEFAEREAAIKRDVERFVVLNKENDEQLKTLNALRGK